MSIVIINHSDTRGGASVVSLRLLNALCDLGVDAKMLVTHKASDNPNVIQVGNVISRKKHFIAEHLRLLSACRGDKTNIFKLSIATDGLPLSKHPLVKNADIIILNWINQGMISLGDIEKMASAGKKIIWTMHDMWNATGICHHAGDCCHWEEAKGCSNCPMLGKGASNKDISARTWQRKKELYANTNITFVAVSSWLADVCRRSPLMQDCNLTTIPNAFPVDNFRAEPKQSRRELGLPENGSLIVMGAARLDDPIKGLDLAIDALNRLADCGATAVFFGALKDTHALDRLKMPHRWLGTIADMNVLANIYSHATVVLSSSHYETLPGTLIEGQASGAFPVAFDRGGQRDIIDHLHTGYLATYPDTEALAAGIKLGLTSPIPAKELQMSTTRFSAPTIAKSYLQL